jgi:hypothetical protein
LDLVSGCGFDGDPVAECSGLGEMVAKLTFGVQTTGVVWAILGPVQQPSTIVTAPLDEPDG